MDWKCLEEQGLSATDVNDLNEFFLGCRIDLRAFQPRIDESAQTNSRERPRFVRRDVSIEVGQNTFGKVVGLNLIFDCELLDFGNQAIMAADGAPQKAFVSQPI